MAKSGASDMWFWGIIGGIWGICLIFSLILKSLKIFENIRLNRKSDLEAWEDKLKKNEHLLNSEKSKHESRLMEERHAIDQLYKEKSQGFPWLAKAFAEYQYLIDLKNATHLEVKNHPAKKTAAILKEISKDKREIQNKYQITKSLLEMYESLFPFLIDFRGEDLDDYIRVRLDKSEHGKEPNDEVILYTTEGERDTLSRQEIFQRALDRYWQKKKRPWELGRDYERYIGYLYEKEGYSVYYQGIVEGLQDLGRDLIVKKGSEIAVIQCKYWSQHKTIHEKHICQLFGTTLKYWIEHQNALQKELKIHKYLFPELIKRNTIKGIFITSTILSAKAHEFAKELGIIIKENYAFQKYPSIKCNISHKTGEKIYHLPFDQQYDRTTIDEERTECYMETVNGAENLGFRRAFRWKSKKENN